MPMYRHMKPNIHTPYSITHIGIGSWLVSYVVFMGTDHVPWLTMYRHMKANIHHPYSIRHIGIGFWIGSYVVFMVTVHVPPYETKHPYSILHHAYRYWVMACVICCFYGDGPCTDIWRHTSIIHTQSRILYIYIYIYIGSWLGSYVVFMVTDHVPSYGSTHPSSILNLT